MNNLTSSNFGILIAFVLPGAVALLGVSYFSPLVASWLAVTTSDSPSIGGFLYLTLAAVLAGLTASTVRWMVIDTIHHWTGIGKPRWDFSEFDRKVTGYDKLGEVHYRFYQFYGNTLMALIFSWICRRVNLGFWTTPLSWLDLGALLLAAVFFAGSRDTFHKYSQRLEMLLGREQTQ